MEENSSGWARQILVVGGCEQRDGGLAAPAPPLVALAGDNREGRGRIGLEVGIKKVKIGGCNLGRNSV